MIFAQDLRHGLRMLAKAPGFNLAAVLTLALGIGANTAIFSVVDAVVLRPLPFPRSNQLVAVESVDTIHGGIDSSASYPDFFDWRSQNRVFSGMTAFHDTQFTLTGVHQAEHLGGEVVSSNFFSTLGAAPALGRGFLPEEEKPGHHRVILSHRLWQSDFGADPGIIGRSIMLNGQGYTVVGVMPAEFQFPPETPPVELWATISADAEAPAGDTPMTAQRGAHWLSVMARLSPGMPLERAQADMGRIAANLAKQYPDSNVDCAGARLEPELERLLGNVTPLLWILFAAVGCVLLIACANVANLLLARALGREKEMAIRAALGASGGRVVRQLLTESVTLSLAGGAVGLLLAAWSISGVLHLAPQDVPRMGQIRIDGAVFLFTLLVAVATGLVFGLAPALHGVKTNLVGTLKESGRGLSQGVRQNRMRSVLVVTEMALAVALLACAGLLIRSFARLERVNPGFNARNLLTFRVSLPDARYTNEQQVAFYDTLRRRLAALPGVRAAGVLWPLPLSHSHIDLTFSVVGHPTARADQPDADIRFAGPGTFRIMGIPLEEGREFTEQDSRNAAPVAVVNQAFVEKFFPGQDPIGQRIVPDVSDHHVDQVPPYEVIGVVGNVKSRNLSDAAPAEFYLPYSQVMISGLTTEVRTAVAPQALASAVRGVVASIDPDIPVYDVETMEQYVGAAVAQPRFSMLLLSLFAGLALVLTALGLYGVISYAVAQQTHEFGVRMALGAAPGDVRRQVLMGGARLALAGIVIGLAGALGVTRLLHAMLFGVSASDPATFAAVAAALAAVALAASYLPARRATRVDPVVALRQE
ncbi:MAG TPA: ABC transporter permease [Candidatus Acidoferrales bacterium]|nr:ABC transporter permease [Candidatus Acidoferrales bacterium]